MKKNLDHKTTQELNSSDPDIKASALKKALMVMRQQYNSNLAEHEVSLAYMREKLVGKLNLVGIMGQGVSQTFVTDVKSDTPGVLAVAISTDKNAGEEGMYFDARQLTFFYTYSELETEAYMKRLGERQGVTKLAEKG